MPGWHNATKELRENGELVILGVVQEQHAERARLYAQWKQFDWPVVQDQMTSIGIGVVPVAILIDEYGIVQNTRPRSNLIKKLVAKKRNPPKTTAPMLENNDAQPLPTLTPDSSVENLVLLGDEHMKNGSAEKTISAYSRALKSAHVTTDQSVKKLVPAINFRLGVAYREKFDFGNGRSPEDFATASQYWTTACESNPNQYIWRRRIEQYGPRNIKPYPFYDWVDQAIADITARGEKPVELKVALAGAEIAQPSKKIIAGDSDAVNPDPESKIELVDSKRPMIRHLSTVVPSHVTAGETVRVHLQLFNGEGAKWNNESTPMQVWINDSTTGTPSQQLVEWADTNESTSDETRTIEFEYQTKEDTESVRLTGFVLANVCSDSDGQCLFRRCNFEIEIPISK